MYYFNLKGTIRRSRNLLRQDIRANQKLRNKKLHRKTIKGRQLIYNIKIPSLKVGCNILLRFKSFLRFHKTPFFVSLMKNAQFDFFFYKRTRLCERKGDLMKTLGRLS